MLARRLALLTVALLLTPQCKRDAAGPAGRGAASGGAVSLAPPIEPPPEWVAAGAEPAVEEEALAGEEQEEEPLRLSVDPCSTAGCELVVRFSLPMVEAEKLAEAAVPKIAMSPKQKGSWAWRSSEELVFTPAEGALNWGQEVSLTLNRAVPLAGEQLGLPNPWEWSLTVPYFSAGGKVAYWPVVRGEPTFVGFLNRYSGQIGKGPLFLLYDQPVNAKKVKDHLSANGPDGPLEVKVYRPSSATQVLSEELDPAHLVAVQLAKVPADGATVSLDVPSKPAGKEPLFETHTLVVQTRFALESAQFIDDEWQEHDADQPVPLRTRLVLRFSNPFEIDLLREQLTVEPAPPALEVIGDWSAARIDLTLAPGTRYVAKVGPGLVDVLGNKPEKPVRVAFTSRDLPPMLHLPTSATTTEAARAVLPFELRNVHKLTAARHRFPNAASFARALARDGGATCKALGAGAAERLAAPAAPEEKNSDATLELPLGPEPGLYCVELDGRGRGSEAGGALRQTALVQSTDLGLTAKVFSDAVFAWVTSLTQAQPLAGAKLTLLDGRGQTLGEGSSDANGTARLAAAGAAAATGLKAPLYLVAEQGAELAVLELENERLTKAWQFGLKQPTGAEPLPAALFTERGAYRPGETMHAKLIAPGLGSTTEAQLLVTDPRGQQVVKKSVALDAFGGAALDLPLKKAAPVGEYALRASVGEQSLTRTFRVEEYRIPTFKVEVSGGAWRRDAEVEATIAAAYLHGGSLDGRELRWEVVRAPESFTPAAFPDFVFTLGDASNLAGTVTGRVERLDGGGQRVVRFKADHPSSAGPMRYTVDAAVTDVDRQTYAGRLSRLVHPAAFYVGVRVPPRAVLGAGETLTVPIAAVTPEGKPLAGVQVRAHLERIDHHTTARLGTTADAGVQLSSRPVIVEQSECLVTTSASVVTCSFKLPAAGAYQVRAWAQDLEQQVVQAGFRVTASGDNPVAWPRFDQDRIEVIADKASYAPGETARLVVQSPFTRATGLLTLERDGVLESRLFTIDGDTPALEVPLSAAHAPNLFASVVLVRGRVHGEKDGSGFETGAPAFKIGYANLKVEPTAQRLAVELTPSRKTASPGSSLTLTLAARDATGKPSAAQATVWVVDEAVLGLTGYRTPDPVAAIYRERPLGVRTGESRLELPHAKRSRLEQLFPGGDGGDEDGQGVAPTNILRRLFESTAYWNPAVPIGADGRAEVSFTLPDNTTTYRAMVVVVDRQARVGSAEAQVVVKLPLMVQAVMPRFVYPNDALRVEALVFNGSGQDGEVEVSAELGGLTLTGAATQKAPVADGKTTTLAYQVKVTGKGKARLRFAARLGALRDAVEVSLPILEPGVKRSLVASKTVSGSETLALALPADRVPGTVQLEVVASTTALTELKDSVQYLMQYPNGCIEQTTSTAYPLVVLKDLLPEIGVEVDQAELKKFTEAGIRRILSFQTEAGGLSYWPGSSEPHAFATAFGLTALIEGKKRGFDIPDQALARMADYLETTLRKGSVTEDIPHGNIADGDTRALFVMTLGRLGRPQPAYVQTLWQEKQKLTAFGLSFLGIAAAELPGQTPLLKPILAEVRARANEEIEEAWYKGEPKGGYSFDSPLRTHASALLAYAQGAPASEMSGKLLTGLLKRRQYGLWGNTQENVFGIMGVHALVGGKEGGSAPSMRLAVNGKDYDPEGMEKVSRRVRRLSLGEEALALPRGKEAQASVAFTNAGGKPVIVTARAQFDVELSEKNRAAEQRGFVVTRRYETLDGQALDGQPVPLGALVRVRLGIKTSQKLNYVAIDDKLPAGLEPLNTALATTETVAQGPLGAVAQKSLGLLSYQEIRDHRVAFYADDLPAGEYEYSYVARATTPGRFLRPAARAEAMYRPDVYGTSSIDEVTVQ